MKLHIKPTNWSCKDLVGRYLFTIKLDGIRLTRCPTTNELVTRLGNKLHNLPDIPPHITDAEVFCGSWSDTVSATKTHNGTPIPLSCIYSIAPLDPRLFLFVMQDPTAEDIKLALEGVLKAGHEGLVLVKQESGVSVQWLKVKPKETHDVKVIGYQEGTGRNKGRLGALLTAYGKVGTGFTDSEREAFAEMHSKGELIGALIEVECMGFTSKCKFRHPRYVRLREDKGEESVQQV